MIKYTKLVIALFIDLVGTASYLLPALGEFSDLIWSILSSGILMFVLFPNHKVGAVFNGVEEILPGTDIIPTATLLWLVDYVKNNDKTFEVFIQKEVYQDNIINDIINSNNIRNKYH